MLKINPYIIRLLNNKDYNQQSKKQIYISLLDSTHKIMSKLNITDLLSSLQTNKKQSQEINTQVPKFVDNVLKDKNKKINVLSKKQEEMMRRQSNYEMTKQQMDKWIGIVKSNREKQSLNFVQKDVANLNVNFFPAQPINQFHKKIQSKLQSMNVQSQKAVLKHEEAVFQKLDPEQAQRRLNQARKSSLALFYQEQKRRRISKIKSKLYHKIKKRQKLRDEAKKIDQMTPAEKNQYIQKLTKQRIKQRITLRHSSKNKHIQNLLRFNRNQKNGIQKQINSLNDIRHTQLERLNQNMIDQLSEQYDDENFREQAMKDLQRQIQAIQNQKNQQNGEQDQIDSKFKDLKFIQNAKQKRLNKQKQDAIKILSKLKKGKQLKQKDVADSEMDQEQSQKISQQQQNSESQQQQNHKQRKVYGEKLQQDGNKQTYNPHSSKKSKNNNIESQLKNYLLGGNVDQKLNNQQLVKGINVQNLQSKYQPQRIPLDLTKLINQNRQIYQHQGNQAVLENIREFQKEKFAEIQEELNKNQSFNKSKQLKGWGNWAGPGINQRKVDPQEQLRKKLKAIEQIKKKRKDNALAHVTITQTRNKNLSQYFVRDLPHNYANADQFDYMQAEPIGPQWNSLNQFRDNIKPKVIAKAGQVILPVKLPRKIQKQSRNK